MKHFFLLSLFLFSIFGSGCDWIYRALQREGAEERDILGEVVVTKKNENVVKIQKLLKLYGYRVGRPDGILGGNTREAIGLFQEDHGLKVTRFVDKDTYDALIRMEDLGLVKKEALDYATVQKALHLAGFDPGPVDGKLGRRTTETLKAFQKSQGLKPDGRIGIRTMDKMAVYLEEESR